LAPLADKSEIDQRRTPRQARSRATFEAIVEAAAQILERRGADALTTNHVAERAGVSIGTLYQYFSDKRALLLAAARRDLAPDAASSPNRRRALIQALIVTLERFGQLGGGATGATAQRAASAMPQPRRSDRDLSRDALDIVRDWLATLFAPPKPALRPIPIPIHIQCRLRE
jgi:AcrR family transcriptional regulator